MTSSVNGFFAENRFFTKKVGFPRKVGFSFTKTYTGKHLPRPKKRKHSAEEQEEFVKHTKKAEKENSEVAGVRANVENAFAFVKNHFKSLDSPWLGDVEQFFYVIKYC